jgi:beta-glucosidase
MKQIRYTSCIAAALLCVVLFLGFSTGTANCQEVEKNPLFMDHTKSYKARVDDLVSRMTLEEKLSQLMSRTPADLPRFGISGYEWSGQGATCCESRYGGTVTVFPHAIAQASTWNKDLIHRVGTAISDESRARVNHGYERAGLTFWAPVVEMARDPRWGRNHESYGEDPYLTAQIALAWVKGIQGDHPRYLKAIAAPKHFAANNEEWSRHNGSAEIDEQLLREYYLYPYQVLVEDGKAESMMAAYNALNGVPCAGNKLLLTDILRDEWGFTGSVVTDCNGIKDLFDGHKYVENVQEAIALALNAGIDMECGDYFKQHLLEVVADGLVSEEIIDQALRRLFLSRFKLGLYDPPELVPYNQIPLTVMDGQAHRALARETARQAIILLKNQDNILPLDKDKISSIAVIGPTADVCLMGGYGGKASIVVSPLEGIVNKFDSSKVRFVKGTDIKITLPIIPTDRLVPPNAKTGEHGLLGEYFNNTDCSGKPVFTRIDPLLDFDYSRGSPDPQIENDYYSVRWSGQFIAPVSGPYYIGAAFDDAIRFYFENKLIIDKTLNRNQNSTVAKLELEKGKHYDLRIEFTEHWYKSKMKLWGAPQDPHKFDKVREAAKNSDVAIVVIGTDETVEKEGVDRSSLELPGDQNDLIKAVYEANPKTVVVMQNGSPLAINWANDNVPAILETFYNGEEGGNALADVIFGDYNPAGRLPMTFYKSDDQLPSISDYDIRKGRTYMYPVRNFANPESQNETPLYPFGYGLSYTNFSYGPMNISSENINPEQSVSITTVVTNTGNRVGDEVVQLYVHDEKASVVRPLKQLMEFERMTLEPGESKTVHFTLLAKDLSFWDIKKKAFVVEPGTFKVLVGSSSADIKSSGQFKIN